MTGFVLVRDDGAFVARHPSPHSYTTKLQDAKVYHTREALEAERCGNEHAVALESILWEGL